MVFKGGRRSAVEVVVLLVMFFGFLALMSSNLVSERQATNQTALYYELAMLRQGINMYVLIEKKKPDSLIQLAVGSYQLPGEGKVNRYVDTIKIDDDGNVIDPFGTVYKYDSAAGWVTSTTEGYTDW